MNKKELIEGLRELINEIPHLKRINHKNQKYPLWRDKVKDTLEYYFGENSKEYKRFVGAGFLVYNPLWPEDYKQSKYIDDLETDERKLNSIIHRLEIIKTSKYVNLMRFLNSNLFLKPLQWIKSHKIPSIIITAIMLIAAIITIWGFVSGFFS